MATKHTKTLVLSLLLFVLPPFCRPQSFNATISGTVKDPSGAVIPGVELTLTSVATGATRRATADASGIYTFPNLAPAPYELRAAAKGFRDFVQRRIEVNMNESVRLDVKLELGTALQTVQVSASASSLNFENAQIKEAITPGTIRELPLIVSGTIRNAASFISLMPGVNTGGGNNPFDARVNGGLQTGDEAVVDGITMQEGLMSQTA
jgi:hypothetical protein